MRLLRTSCLFCADRLRLDGVKADMDLQPCVLSEVAWGQRQRTDTVEQIDNKLKSWRVQTGGSECVRQPTTNFPPTTSNTTDTVQSFTTSCTIFHTYTTTHHGSCSKASSLRDPSIPPPTTNLDLHRPILHQDRPLNEVDRKTTTLTISTATESIILDF